jgi:hypothetical protein
MDFLLQWMNAGDGGTSRHPAPLKETSNMKSWIGAVLSVAFAASAFAQPAPTVSVPPANVPLRPVADGAASTDQLAVPTYEISLGWSARDTTVLTVPFRNTDERPLRILGVQATHGLFVGDFPSVVAPGREETIAFVYRAAEQTDGDLDLIRVLTDQGIREVRIKVVREEALTLDLPEVRWTAGDPVAAKIVKATVRPGTVQPVRARATGGHAAVLEKVSDTVWNIRITPASTARSGTFAVFLDLDRPLPGRASVILGTIQPKE